MHTSTQISLMDFSIRDAQKNLEVDFDKFCPNYYYRDRIAVINLEPNEGLLGASRTLFTFTAAFYESLRSTNKPFFNYPQHFTLFVGGENPIPEKDTKPWTMLDVWPNSQWFHCENNVDSLLQTLFDLQVNRIIWPAEWKPTDCRPNLPDTLYKILFNRLDEIFFYNSKTAEINISISGKSFDFWHEAVSHAPESKFGFHPFDSLHTRKPKTLFSLCGIDIELL